MKNLERLRKDSADTSMRSENCRDELDTKMLACTE